jgi:hypothetical protein
MADQKLYDMVVTVGEYVDRNGNQKRQYETIGTVFQGQKGMYAVMKKTFNPAGVPSERSSFFVSFYEPRDRQEQRPQQAQSNQSFDDDLPF